MRKLSQSKKLRPLQFVTEWHFRLLFVSGGLLSFYGCGVVSTDGTSLNEPAPSGTIVAQGTFESRNQKTVSGGATVYLVSAGSYVLRLEGISVPTTVSLQAVLASGSTIYVQQLLKSSQGSMNYSFSIADGSTPTFSYASFFSASENLDYGKATLVTTP